MHATTAMSFEHLHAMQLAGLTDPGAAASAFKRGVRMVEIEVFSYCNRRCWFCPNATIDRISSNTLMPEPTYLAILDQLASIGYARMIS